MSPIHDGFDVIAIRVQHECGVIAGMVRARTGSAVVSAAGGERGCMERLHGLLAVSQERDGVTGVTGEASASGPSIGDT